MDRSLGRGAFGKLGESIAERFLEKKGYEILEKNFRCRLGEIDLIAKEGGEIVFVEVKSRHGSSFGFPEEQISRKKQRKLGRLAEFYLKRRRQDEPARIDVVAILQSETGELLSLQLIPNAIGLSG